MFPVNGSTTSQVANSIPTGAERVWRRHLIGFLPIATLYLLLGFYRIDHQSLWTDEVISVSRISAESFWVRVNSQSSLYFVLLDLWTELAGSTELALRSLSLLLGLAAVCLVYAIGLKLFDRRIALVTATLLATSPYVIWYAQEVRYITLLLVTSLAMTYSFWRALASRGWGWWLSYSVTSALALFTFATVVFLVIVHGLFLLWRSSNRSFLKKWAASQLIIILAFTAWFISGTVQRLAIGISKAPSIVSQEQVRSREQLTVTDLVGAIPYTFFAFSVGFSLGPSLEELHVSRSLDPLLSHTSTLVPTAVLFVSLFVVGLTRLRQDNHRVSFLLLWLGVPIIGTFTIATLTTYHVYNTRYVVIALPAYLLILARGIAGFRRSGIQILVLAAVLCVNGMSLFNYYFDDDYGREDSRAAAEYLESAARPGDVIVAVGDMTALDYYYKGTLPIEVIDARGASQPRIIDLLRPLAEAHSRLWLVEIRPWETDPKALTKASLDRVMQYRGHKRLAGANIYAYARSR